MFCVSHIYVCRFVLVLDLHITSLSLHTHTCSLLTHCMQKPPKIRLTLHSWVRSTTRRGGGRPPVPNVRAIQYPTFLPHHSLSQYMGGSNLLLSASFCISRYSVRLCCISDAFTTCCINVPPPGDPIPHHYAYALNQESIII